MCTRQQIGASICHVPTANAVATVEANCCNCIIRLRTLLRFAETICQGYCSCTVLFTTAILFSADHLIKARVIACVSFDRGICGFQSSTWVYIESLDVAIVPKQKVGRGSYFDGKAHLTIPRFTNSYSRFSEFAISFWYKRVAGRRGQQGLVTNDISGELASISVVSTENSLAVRLLTDHGKASLTGVPVSIDRPSSSASNVCPMRQRPWPSKPHARSLFLVVPLR